MISGDVAKLVGKKIKEVVAYDMFGYDRGFEIRTEDGVCLEFLPYVMWEDESRIRIEVKGGG